MNEFDQRTVWTNERNFDRSSGPTDGQTDRRTDRRTDTVAYRDARTHLKRKVEREMIQR